MLCLHVPSARVVLDAALVGVLLSEQWPRGADVPRLWSGPEPPVLRRVSCLPEPGPLHPVACGLFPHLLPLSGAVLQVSPCSGAETLLKVAGGLSLPLS